MGIPIEPIVPPRFQSDGCTMNSVLGRLLGSRRYRNYCREHDFLRRHKVVSVIKANWILSYRIANEHAIGWLRSPIYFIGTTVTWPFYRKTKSLPVEWRPYAKQYN